MTKRFYGKGGNRHTEQYNSYLSKGEFDQLEELRIKVAMKKGISPKDYSRGSFLMWMYRRCYTTLEDDFPFEDFCDRNISGIEDVISHLQEIIKTTQRFKDDANRIDSEDADSKEE